MNINFRITSTTNFPELKIDDILKNLGVEPNLVYCEGKEFTIDEVKSLPYTQQEAEWVFIGSCHIADMLGWVARLPQGSVKEAKGYNINRNNIENGKTVVDINLDFATRLNRKKVEIIRLTLGDDAAQSYSDKSYASDDGAW